jgi:hypothetical protein
MTRRDAIAVMGAAGLAPLFGAAAGDKPWYATMRRCGQTNFNERDPIELDIDWWIRFWKSMRLDAVLINGGGIMAFYPTQIPYHHRSQFLGGSLGKNDLFGDFLKAAKTAGMRVVARMDCNYVYEEAFKAHPEWVVRNRAGAAVTHAESPWLYQTCMHTSYFSEQMPAIYREMNSLYDVDGYFTNGWPSTGRPTACFCEACKGAPDPASPAGFERHLNRTLEIWKQWDGVAKQKKADSVYVGNLGGGIRAVLNLNRVAGIAGWFNADHQGRSGATPIWDCAQQGRVAQSVMGGRTITNVTGGYANSAPLWRHTSKAAEETTMWMAQTTASGMTPWFHWLGGAPEDTRWTETGRKFYQWIAANEKHFVNQGSVAKLGVVFSEQTNAFYRAPGGTDNTEFMEGMYKALLDGRFVFDFVHEDRLAAESLKQYSALILPNAACLSEAQCAALRAYADGGGSLLATFETAMYDEHGAARAESGLADVFGFQRAGARVAPNGNSAYARIERDHAILEGFAETKLLPLAEYYIPLKAVANPVLTVLPPYPAFPPEMVYPRETHTDQPAVVLSESGKGRRAYIAGDMDRSFWRSQDGDLSRLLGNTIRWVVNDSSPVTVDGDGVAELFAWKTEAGHALHLLNYTNPNMLRGWMTHNYPIGAQKVRFAVPAGTRVAQVQLLRAGKAASFVRKGNVVEFVVPQVVDYEVAAII